MLPEKPDAKARETIENVFHALLGCGAIELKGSDVWLEYAWQHQGGRLNEGGIQLIDVGVPAVEIISPLGIIKVIIRDMASAKRDASCRFGKDTRELKREGGLPSGTPLRDGGAFRKEVVQERWFEACAGTSGLSQHDDHIVSRMVVELFSRGTARKRDEQQPLPVSAS